MLEAITTGIVQGVAEWMPVSSEGLLVLIKTNFFGSESLGVAIEESLFLHLGTFFAALIYFRKDVVHLLKQLFSWNTASDEDKKILKFLIVSTIIGGLIGLAILQAVKTVYATTEVSGIAVNVLIGLLLLITGVSQLATKSGSKRENDLTTGDGVLLGILEGLSALPGVSRSGSTVSGLLLRKFDKEAALRLSFLMSLPIVLAGNIVLNLNKMLLTTEALAGLLCSFIFGYLTIGALLKLARKVNFGYFVILFAILTLAATLII